MNRCDIIIPVYNAYESVVECVESVIKSTDLKKNGLIIINDKSTDNRIEKYLKKIKKNFEKDNLNIEILNNKKNLGFVKTVNRGMKLSKNDVLLLNSDTEVSNGWLEKIKECAYSSEDVATVTPLSNNATLVSVPNCLEPNKFEGLDLEKYNSILEKLSNKEYLELPTGHGFCLFIKRAVLNLVGYFDEETFGTGYGEENDFCYRCLDFGFRHLLCDNTIVFHKESQSFKNKRDEVIDAHLKILRERYPIYCQRTDEWLKILPISKIALKIYYALNFSNNKPNVLILIHDWETKTGGTTLHVRDLIEGLKDKYNFVVLFKSNLSGNYGLSTVVGKEEKCIYLKNYFTYSDFCYRNKEYKQMVNCIIEDFNINTIHIHHMKGHYFDIIDVSKKHNIKTVITLHDFYCLCPTINMIEFGKKCCIDNKNKDCSMCLKKTKNIENNIIKTWQEQWHRFLKAIDIVITPSDDAKEHILKYYDDLKIKSIEHGLEMPKSKYVPEIKEKINVAMIGVLCKHKGGEIFKSLISEKNDKIQFHSFGYSEIPSLTKNKKNYIHHGIYKRENLHCELEKNKIDLICFFQKWPETYSYTLNEAISAGIPVLSFNIGAGAERIKKYGFGWVIDIDLSTSEIIEKIVNIHQDKKGYSEKLIKIKNYKLKNISQMCDEYDKIYTTKKNCYDYKFININNILFENEFELEKLNSILHSTKWKLINKIKFPKGFVYFVRKVIKKGE